MDKGVFVTEAYLLVACEYNCLLSFLGSTHVHLHTCPIYTNGYDSSNWWSIGTNGTIGTNGKAPYSNGSIGEYASIKGT